MGIVNGMERGLERMVGRLFRGASTDGVKPVEIANRLRNTMDDEAFALSEGRTVAPHSFTIRLGDDDYAKAREWGQPLAQELADVALEHAQAQDYTLRDAVRVTFRHDASLQRGRLEVDASLGGPQAPAPRPPARPAPEPVQQYMTERITPSLRPVIDIDGDRYAINADRVSIGRSSEADITLPDGGISRKHVGLIREGEHVYVEDLGSTNGTLVDGRKIADRVRLRDGSVIKAGHTTMTFHFIPETPEVN